MALASRAVSAEVEIDVSQWPVIVVTPPPVPITDAMLDAFMAEWLELMTQRRQRYVCINDLRRAPHMSAAHRRKMTDWMNSFQHDLAAFCCGAAMVFDSALMRGAMTAMLWMFKPPYPTSVFKTREEAIGWAKWRLAEDRR